MYSIEGQRSRRATAAALIVCSTAGTSIASANVTSPSTIKLDGPAPWFVDHSKFAWAFGAEVTPHREAISATLGWFHEGHVTGDSMLSFVSEPQLDPIPPESLARERCVELRAGTPALTTEEARGLAAAIAHEWQVDGAAIRREFTFKTFNAAFGLATRIALLAESQNHHPELEVAWGHLVVRLTTHSVGGLSRNDFIMAARIDRLAGG